MILRELGSVYSRPWPKAKPAREVSSPERIAHASRPSKAMRPRQTTTRRWLSSFSSSSSHGAQLRSSSGVGLLPGGAQRTTELIHMPVSVIPSSREMARGCDAKPASCNTGYKKSPDPSPVKGLPVRLEPCAPGASPSTSTRAEGSPKDGTGFPQYSQSAYERRRMLATLVQCSRSREQRLQAAMREFKTLNEVRVEPIRKVYSFGPRQCKYART